MPRGSTGAAALLRAAAAALIALRAAALLFLPDAPGQIWDPSCLVWQGATHCFFMYQPAGSSRYTQGSLAVAADGVHFVDRGAVSTELPGVQWWKCFVRPVGTPQAPLFVMDHGTGMGDAFDNSSLPGDRGCPFHGQCMRFLGATDLQGPWAPLYSMHPDPRYYDVRGRWDHMYMQLDSARGPGALIGFPVATPLGSPAPGVMRSADSGATWTVEAPLDIAWGPVSPVGVEVGGVEQLRADGPFFLIGGTVAYNVGGYSMYVLRSDAGPAGPFAPVVGGFRLSGTSSGRCCITALAAFAKDYDSGAVLVSQYIVTSTATDGRRPSLVGGGDVWLLPLRLPAEDADGRLVLTWWPGNSALAGAAVPGVAPSATLPGGAALSVVWLGDGDGDGDGAIFNTTTGIVVEATLLPFLASAGAAVAVGISIESEPPQSAGPDFDTDRPGSDQRCFPEANISACAADCGADAACDAWAWVPGPQVGPPRSYPCSNNEPLPRPYCSLKRPAPPQTHAPGIVSGLKPGGGGGVPITMLLLSARAAGLQGPDPAGSTVVAVARLAADNRTAVDAAIVDASGAFPCGPDGQLCGDATLTSLDPTQPHALMLYVRRGMFELYVDGRLVQTFLYGSYPAPAAGGRVGFAANATAASFTNVTVRSLTLE